MSNLLNTERVETVIIPVVFNATASAIGNFNFPFNPKVLQISQTCNFTLPAVAELVVFRINGKPVGGTFSNTGLSGLSNPVFFKSEADNYWGQCEVTAFSALTGSTIALTGTMVFICTLVK